MPPASPLLSTNANPEYQPFLAEFRLRRAIARARVALASFDTATAETELAAAADAASAANHSRDSLTVQVLRAVAARDAGSEQSIPLFREALSLATMRGCLRMVDDAHPVAVKMREELNAQSAAKLAPPSAPMIRTGAQKTAATTAGLLTPKEAEVLRLLAAGHSNKHIAKAMDISDETVKWHLKNLFSKLSAGTRRHAVDRARMMGLVVEEGSGA